MNSSVRVCLLAVFIGGSLCAAPPRQSIARTYSERPLLFAPAQTPDGEAPQFSARASGHQLLFGASGTVSEWGFEDGSSDLQPEIAMRLVDARRNVLPQAAGPQTGSANYLLGSDPDQWRIGVPQFARIIYRGVYPGIDLIYYGNQNQLEYDFVVAPGASWSSIHLAFQDAQAMKIDANGDLQVETHWGWLRHCRPQIYQQFRSGRRQVSGHYVLQANGRVGFQIGAHDPRVSLVIDPTLVYSSYLGGSADDHGYSVAVDSAGSAYTVGETWSNNLPMLNPAQSFPDGNTDIFVTKWNTAGTGILYSTYIGGGNRDVPLSIAVDTVGNAYIAGYTYSANFPTTSGALRSSFVGQSKAFVLKLNASGNSLIYSTFLGGDGNDYATGIAVDALGQAHISGYTSSINFPVSANPFQRFYGGGEFDGFFAKLNAAGSQLVYATYLGGAGNDTAFAVALDPASNIYLTGQTQSANFPVLQALQATYSQSDAFVVKLNTSNQVLYSTYLGGTGSATGTGIAADISGNAYVTGYTTAPDFPGTLTAYQSANHGSYDAFVAKLSSDGSAILGATYFGGSGPESASAIALDSSGDVFVAGSTSSVDLPLQAPVQASYSGGGDAFVAGFNNQLSSLNFSTYYGGAQSDTAAGIAVDSSGNAYLTGTTNSGGPSMPIPTSTGAFQASGQGGLDAFLAKFSFAAANGLMCTASSPAPVNIPASGAAEQVGDLVLTCTGGTAGATAITDIQVSLNGTVANGMQAQLLIDEPPPSSQISNVNLFPGSLTGSSSIVFSGVFFTVPGPSASHTLRITNVQVNASTVPSPGQVVATISAANSSPAVVVTQPQQTIATAAVQLQSFVMSASGVPANGVAPPATTTFSATAPQALLWFQVSGAASGDVIRADWYAPGGTLYQSSTFDAGPVSGNQCFWDTLTIAGSGSSMSGAWQVSAYWNNAPLFTAPFTISPSNTQALFWQKNTTRQVTTNYYSGATITGWNWVNATGIPGWTAVAVADMNGDGVPDLIWQNNTTRQVTVNYYGGSGGTSFIGWNWLNATGIPGWTVVAVADMNGDGVPDLIWQNDTTRQVTVNYYGGSGGATLLGWNWLNATGIPGWTVVAVADFDGNGVPDLIWQNTVTRQVTVNYYGGTGGASLLGWHWLNSSGIPGWTVVGASDFDNNGVPDLVWQSDATAQVTVNYYGGAGGATLEGWNWLNSSGIPGWHAFVP